MKKRFFAKHAKSSAALVSLGIHAVLLLIALSFVAVTVIQKEEKKFEAKPVSRSKMNLRKLQVPVNIKKKKVQKPKLRKRIVVQPKMNQTMPDIKMPEITGVKGGLGNAAGDGLGGAGALGFSMPEIELFGIKGRGEKIFIILDSTPWIMYDELGGIPAYTLIKQELVKILGGLNSTVVFNVAVYGHQTGSYTVFPGLVPATASNVAKVEQWLHPLNAVKAGGYGTKTLGPGGIKIEGADLVVKPLKGVNHWSEPAMYAMKQRVDTVFLLAHGWGHLLYDKAPRKEWSEAKMTRFREIEKKARAKLAEENRQRKANGQPERVLVGWSVVKEYFPGTETPPLPERHWYTPKEMVEAFVNQRKANADQTLKTSGLGNRSKKKQDKISLNVVQFVPNEGADAKDEARFKQLTSLLYGEYRALPGMEAIQSAISPD
ncbi:hypothetical protein P4B35_06060 [Pontiellaceae bacterium B12227]|nr:hypothetical protein [Pontiellaceae bacterium B12227]